MDVCLITQDNIIWQGSSVSATLNTLDGEITVLDGHEKLISVLVPGELRILTDQSNNINFAVTGGFVEVLNNKVTILADSADHFDELDETKANEAKIRAEKLLEGKLTDIEVAEVEATLQKALLHLRIVKKKKHHTSL